MMIRWGSRVYVWAQVKNIFRFGTHLRNFCVADIFTYVLWNTKRFCSMVKGLKPILGVFVVTMHKHLYKSTLAQIKAWCRQALTVPMLTLIYVATWRHELSSLSIYGPAGTRRNNNVFFALSLRHYCVMCPLGGGWGGGGVGVGGGGGGGGGGWGVGGVVVGKEWNETPNKSRQFAT